MTPETILRTILYAAAGSAAVAFGVVVAAAGVCRGARLLRLALVQAGRRGGRWVAMALASLALVCAVVGQKANTNSPPDGLSAPRPSLAARPESAPSLFGSASASFANEPTNATGVVRWELRGAHDDAVRIPAVGWNFRATDGFLDGLTILSRGEFRPDIRHATFARPFASEMSFLPRGRWNLLPDGGESRLWYAATPSNSLLVTCLNWLVDRNPNTPTNFQAEFFPDGTYAYRYGDRVETHSCELPFDWDGDGLENSVDPNPRVAGPDAHNTNAEWYNVVCSNVLETADGTSFAWRDGVHSNAYYFVDVAVSRAPAPVYFVADGPSNLGDPAIVATAGSFDLTTQNLDKLDMGGGVPLAVETSRTLAPYESHSQTFVCTGRLPSGSAGDVRVEGTFTEDGTGVTIEADTSLTVVKVELEAQYAAPENACQNRHVYGVGERVKFKIRPQLASVQLKTQKRDVQDLLGAYELLDGDEETTAAADHIYTCPISATYTPTIRVSMEDVVHYPVITIVEPQEVVTQTASFDGVCWQSGECGEAGLRTVNYVGPMHVSFEGIAVSEVPATENDIIAPTGWFTNLTSHLFHGTDERAGFAHWIKPGNYWMVDNASSSGPVTNWSAGTLYWKIPIGWHRKDYTGNGWHRVEGPDYEMNGKKESRPLLIGGRKDLYMQKRTIQADGTFLNEKFGWWQTRTLNCRIRLGRDGEIGNIVQWWH